MELIASYYKINGSPSFCFVNQSMHSFGVAFQLLMMFALLFTENFVKLKIEKNFFEVIT